MEKIEPSEMVRRLTGFIRTEGRFDSVAIENFRKMPGGASREIWSFECAMERGGETTGARWCCGAIPAPTISPAIAVTSSW